MRPGETTHRIVRVTDYAGAAVTGLTLASFTVVARARAYGATAWSTYTHGAALVEIGGGDYALSFAGPPGAGWWRVYLLLASSSHLAWSASWEGECESYDLDAIYTGLAAVQLGNTRNVYLGQYWPGSLVAYRWNQWEIPVVDQTGAAVDLSGYTDLALSVRSRDQAEFRLDASNGTPTGFVLTASSGGIVTVEWPKTLGAGVADIYAAVPDGALTQSAPLWYEIAGNVGGVSSKPVSIVRSSPLVIYRREVGT